MKYIYKFSLPHPFVFRLVQRRHVEMECTFTLVSHSISGTIYFPVVHTSVVLSK